MASDLVPLVTVWRERLLALSEADSAQLAGSRWTRKQVIGHLIDSAANNHQRFIRLQQGELAGFPGYDQDVWVERGAYASASWSDLVNLWYFYNRQLAVVIGQVRADSLASRWVDRDVDLAFLIQDYESHLRHHLEGLA